MAARRNRRVCPICNEENDYTHEQSRKHHVNFMLMQWHKDRTSLVRNRHGIELTVTFRDQCLITNINKGKHYYKTTQSILQQEGNMLNFKCTISNTRRDEIFLTKVILLYPYSWFSIVHQNNNNPEAVIKLNSNTKYSVIIRFSPSETCVVGGYNIPVCFNFQTNKRDTFSIARSINVSIEEALEENEIFTPSPFTGTPWQDVQHIHRPLDSPRYSNNFPIAPNRKRLYLYGLQENNNLNRSEIDILRNLQAEMSPGEVTRTNFINFWHHVLWMEEIGQELGLQQYNMENIGLNLLENGRLELNVPGLAEKRPSVIVGDMVEIRFHNDHTSYRGVIRKVNDMSVEIGDVNNELIDIIEAQSEIVEHFDVKFLLSRLSFERQHQGVKQVARNGLVSVIFPTPEATLTVRQTQKTINDGEFLDQTIVTNHEQKTAVRNILNATSVPYPYIVFGPPGTGKTVTIVEAILQIKYKTKHKILVCAPSNSACDLITEKLLAHCTDQELIRVMSSNVDISSVHEPVLNYSNYELFDGSRVYRDITSAALNHYRIVVTTLILIGKHTGYYHPDVVFVDEAAQACEPEVCIALSMVKRGQQIVLAGDPKQLGPSLTSDAAKRYGLDVSLLERIMRTDLYESRDPNCITMLIQNFRNHRTILSLPNRLFYENQLEARSHRSELDPISKVFIFQKIKEMNGNKRQQKILGHPVEFCSLLSKESREGKSPSYYNPKELQMVIQYIRALLALQFEEDEHNVKPSDIGVVTPYARQVNRLKQLLQQRNIEGIDVGTTETFQGREKRIIIISTVRAQKDLLLFDKLYKLGFVKNEKRFNVAITRAMSKLIIIGCAHVLATDAKWLSYIELCNELEAFWGAPFARRTEDICSSLTQNMGEVKIDTQYR